MTSGVEKMHFMEVLSLLLVYLNLFILPLHFSLVIWTLAKLLMTFSFSPSLGCIRASFLSPEVLCWLAMCSCCRKSWWGGSRRNSPRQWVRLKGEEGGDQGGDSARKPYGCCFTSRIQVEVETLIFNKKKKVFGSLWKNWSPYYWRRIHSTQWLWQSKAMDSEMWG